VANRTCCSRYTCLCTNTCRAINSWWTARLFDTSSIMAQSRHLDKGMEVTNFTCSDIIRLLRTEDAQRGDNIHLSQHSHQFLHVLRPTSVTVCRLCAKTPTSYSKFSSHIFFYSYEDGWLMKLGRFVFAQSFVFILSLRLILTNWHTTGNTCDDYLHVYSSVRSLHLSHLT
jgi:hypothetical protein